MNSLDLISVAFLLKRFLLLVNNVEPLEENYVKEKNYVKEFFFKLEGNMILFNERDIDLINKVLHEIDYKIIVVDNKLYFEDI